MVSGLRITPGTASTVKCRSPPRKLRLSQPATACTSTRLPTSAPQPALTVLSSAGVTVKTTGITVAPGVSPGVASTDPTTRRSLIAPWAPSIRSVE